MKLYRAMIADTDGLPLVGRSARKLGIRTPLEAAANSRPDVTATQPDEIIQPSTGGMSTTPDDPSKLPPLRRHRLLGGRGKDPVWEIDTDELGPDLQPRQDHASHVLIEPSRPMPLNEFEQALEATRARWQRHTG